MAVSLHMTRFQIVRMEKDSKLSNVEGLQNQSLNTHNGTVLYSC